MDPASTSATATTVWEADSPRLSNRSTCTDVSVDVW